MSTVAQLLQPVESDLEQLLSDLRALIGAGHPILQAAAEHLFSAGGKRLRPGIVLLLSRALDPAGELSIVASILGDCVSRAVPPLLSHLHEYVPKDNPISFLLEHDHHVDHLVSLHQYRCHMDMPRPSRKSGEVLQHHVFTRWLSGNMLPILEQSVHDILARTNLSRQPGQQDRGHAL